MSRPPCKRYLTIFALVEIHDWTYTDVAEQLREFDVFALPSRAEGISNTILEAMATGLPMAVTSVGGNPELVLEGKTGFLVAPADPPALAAVLARYVEDPGLARSHGANGRARAESEFSLEQMVEHYLAVYDRATGRIPAPFDVPFWHGRP